MSEVRPVSLFRLLGFGILGFAVFALSTTVGATFWNNRSCSSGLEFRMDRENRLHGPDGNLIEDARWRDAISDLSEVPGACATLRINTDAQLGPVSRLRELAAETGVRLRLDFEQE